MRNDHDAAHGNEKPPHGSAYDRMSRLLDDATDAEKAEFLTRLNDKGITPEEVIDISRIFRERANLSRINGTTDIVGTGGDGLNTINVSTAAALLASSMGIKVAKHGNFGATSNKGSADFLKYLGYNFEMSQAEAERRIRAKNFAFILAPLYNDNFAKFSNARKMLPFKTIFNYLGPLSNPADPDHSVLGVTDSKTCDLFADYLRLRLKKGFVVYSDDGMDEVSPSSPSTAFFISGNETEVTRIEPKQVTGEMITLNDIATSDPNKAFEMTLKGLEGSATRISRFIALNAALPVQLNDLDLSFGEAYKQSYRQIMSGSVSEHIKEIVEDSR